MPLLTALCLGFLFIGEARVEMFENIHVHISLLPLRSFSNIQYYSKMEICNLITFNWIHLEVSADLQLSLRGGWIYFYFNAQGFRHVELIGEIYLNLCTWK